jgi:ABC-type bacteriocin/lantibiotic exporter with double-glycine peptidase domain
MGNSKKPLDQDKVIEAASLSTANKFIENWEQRYETQLGVAFGGKTPSKGQKQKLALAKTIYRQSLFTILDEPTASMDSDSVRLIADNLDGIGTGKSLLLITHDSRLIERCDKVLLIENGFVAHYGSYLDLKDLSKYSNLVNNTASTSQA